MYECFHCGEKSVIWDGDFSFKDYGLEGDGIVHDCHCENCGARIQYQVPIEKDKPNYICKHGVCAWRDEAEYKCNGCIYYVPEEDKCVVAVNDGESNSGCKYTLESD